ncbi:hypothetical protein HPB47_019851, partial [Ixodes persulcatus]
PIRHGDAQLLRACPLLRRLRVHRLHPRADEESQTATTQRCSATGRESSRSTS